MTAFERRAVFSISVLYSLRMLGLFMILPVFTPYAHTLKGATPFLIGAALGIYGLTQALFQLPFGALSDYYPRKKIIALGFMIFMAGSFLAAASHSIYGVILGRAVQGAGAVGSVLTALLMDLIRPEKRAQSMALVGVTIGLAFFTAIILGPLLNQSIHIQGIFVLTGLLAILAVIVLFSVVPNPPQRLVNKPIASALGFSSLRQNNALQALIKNYQVLSLNIGIFCLHAIFTASFIVIPLWISHWTDYLLPLTVAIVLTFLFIALAEKNKKVFILYFWTIFGLAASELLLFYNAEKWLFNMGLGLFFLSFNLLEANLPSLISRLAPTEMKGRAMGVYASCQFLGIFSGGVLGGWIYQCFSPGAVLLSCAAAGLLWLMLTLIIRFSRGTLWQEV